MVKLGRLLKPREAGAVLGVTPRTIVRWINQGKLGGHKVGRVWRIPSDDPQLHMMLDQSMAEESDGD
jgi:excisionase family DNA binding protein